MKNLYYYEENLNEFTKDGKEKVIVDLTTDRAEAESKTGFRLANMSDLIFELMMEDPREGVLRIKEGYVKYDSTDWEWEYKLLSPQQIACECCNLSR